MEQVKRSPGALLFAGLLVVALIILMAIPNSWEEATTRNKDGSYSISKEWEESIREKREKIDNHELYMLVASQDGMYICNHCPTGKFFLYEGEVYRFGITGNGEDGRGYTEKWQDRNRLAFIHIVFGDEVMVKKKQAELIGLYAIHPENMNRPVSESKKAKSYWYRLVLPPGNNNLN